MELVQLHHDIEFAMVMVHNYDDDDEYLYVEVSRNANNGGIVNLESTCKTPPSSQPPKQG